MASVTTIFTLAMVPYILRVQYEVSLQGMAKSITLAHFRQAKIQIQHL